MLAPKYVEKNIDQKLYQYYSRRNHEKNLDNIMYDNKLQEMTKKQNKQIEKIKKMRD